MLSSGLSISSHYYFILRFTLAPIYLLLLFPFQSLAFKCE